MLCFDESQDAVCPLGCQGTLLAHNEPAVNQHPQLRYCRAAVQSLLTELILVPSIILFQVKNLAFVLLKVYAIDVCPVLQSI